MPRNRKVANLDSTSDAVARHCILGTKQSTRRSDPVWKKAKELFCVGVYDKHRAESHGSYVQKER